MIVQSGRTTTLYAVMSPVAGKARRVVSGTLYVDEATAVTNVYGGSPSANELVAVPYAYTVPAN